MTPAQPSRPDLVFAGSFCHCVRRPAVMGQTHQCYALVSHATGEVIAEVAWNDRTRRDGLTPTPGSTWNSAMLSEAARWLRTLSRVGVDIAKRTTGHLLVALALAWWVLVSA